MEDKMIIELSWALATIFGIINIALTGVIIDLRKRMCVLEKEMVAMKLNYINRFETASKHRNEMEKKLLKAITDLKLENEKAHGRLMRT